jgi:hypothetical protein
VVRRGRCSSWSRSVRSLVVVLSTSQGRVRADASSVTRAGARTFTRSLIELNDDVAVPRQIGEHAVSGPGHGGCCFPIARGAPLWLVWCPARGALTRAPRGRCLPRLSASAECRQCGAFRRSLSSASDAFCCRRSGAPARPDPPTASVPRETARRWAIADRVTVAGCGQLALRSARWLGHSDRNQDHVVGGP